MDTKKVVATIEQTIKTTEEGEFMPANITFTAFKSLMDAIDADGLIIFDVGGDMDNWVKGITKSLFDAGISSSIKPEETWMGIFELIREDSRHDLAFVFTANPPSNIDKKMMEKWRKDKPENVWISDYVHQHTPQYVKDEQE
ncbi:MAG: hypothetical protein U9P80_07125 [Thermodesulfobacteriota bacterium]|nr:hypothetical protein [Thermodesulfobacteriota bacterium]